MIGQIMVMQLLCHKYSRSINQTGRGSSPEMCIVHSLPLSFSLCPIQIWNSLHPLPLCCEWTFLRVPPALLYELRMLTYESPIHWNNKKDSHNWQSRSWTVITNQAHVSAVNGLQMLHWSSWERDVCVRVGDMNFVRWWIMMTLELLVSQGGWGGY